MGLRNSLGRITQFFGHSNGNGGGSLSFVNENLKSFNTCQLNPMEITQEEQYLGTGRQISSKAFISARSRNDKVVQLEELGVKPVDVIGVVDEEFQGILTSGGQDSVAVLEPINRLLIGTGEKEREILGFYVVSDGFSSSNEEDETNEGAIYWNALASRLLLRNSILGVLSYLKSGNFDIAKIIRKGIDSAKKEIIGSATYTSALLTRIKGRLFLETFALGDSPVYVMGIRNGQPILLKLAQSDNIAEAMVMDNWIRKNNLKGVNLITDAQDFYGRNSFFKIREWIEVLKRDSAVGDELLKSFKAVKEEGYIPPQIRKRLKFNLNRLFDKDREVLIYVGSDMIDKFLGEKLYIDYLFELYKRSIVEDRQIDVMELGNKLRSLFHSAEVDDSGYVLKSVLV